MGEGTKVVLPCVLEGTFTAFPPFFETGVDKSGEAPCIFGSAKRLPPQPQKNHGTILQYHPALMLCRVVSYTTTIVVVGD